MYCLTGCSPVLERVIFADNFATYQGAGMLCDEGATLIDVVFTGNFTVHHRAALNLSGATASTLTRVTFAGNLGGAAYFEGCSPTVTSCTFYGNDFSLELENASPVLERTIIAFTTYGPAISCEDPGSQPLLACCDIYGNAGGDWIGCIEDQAGQNGNISEDPLFCMEQNPAKPAHVAQRFPLRGGEQLGVRASRRLSDRLWCYER